MFAVELRALDVFIQTVALQDPAQTQLVDAQILADRPRADGHEIRYQFQIPGTAATYSRIGLAGTSEWVRISEAAWQQAKATRQIAVVYLPDNPWANQPISVEGRPVENSLLGWLVFLVIDLVWVAESYVIVRNFLAAQAAVERRTVQHFRFWRTVRRRTVYDSVY